MEPLSRYCFICIIFLPRMFLAEDISVFPALHQARRTYNTKSFDLVYAHPDNVSMGPSLKISGENDIFFYSDYDTHDLYFSAIEKLLAVFFRYANCAEFLPFKVRRFDFYLKIGASFFHISTIVQIACFKGRRRFKVDNKFFVLLSDMDCFAKRVPLSVLYSELMNLTSIRA